MTTWVHDPSLLSHPNGYSLSNNGTTGVAAGTVMQASLSAGGSVTYQGGRWQHIGNSGVARLQWSTGGSTQILIEYLVDLTTAPVLQANRLIEIRHASGFLARVTWEISGRIRLYNAANSSVFTSASVYPEGSRVRIMVGINPGTTTSDGRLILGLYSGLSGQSTTPDEAIYDASDVNAGTADVATIYFGRVNSDTDSSATVSTVNIQAKDDSLTPIGPLAISTPPVASKTQSIRRSVDWSGSTNATSLSVDSVTGGGLVVGDITVDALAVEFVDQIEREEAVTINVTLSGPGGSTSDSVVVPPGTAPTIVRRIGELIMLDGGLL